MSRPNESDKPRPECKVHSEVDRQQERQPMEKKALVEIAERAEPTKCRGEKNNAGQIAEQQIAQPAAPRIFARKPNCCDQRRKREPAKPTDIKWRKTGRQKKAAANRGEPRPECFQRPDHAAQVKAPNPKPQVSKKLKIPSFKNQLSVWDLKFGTSLGFGAWYLRFP